MLSDLPSSYYTKINSVAWRVSSSVFSNDTKYLQDYDELKDFYFLQIEKGKEKKDIVKLNSFDIYKTTNWQGKYDMGEIAPYKNTTNNKPIVLIKLGAIWLSGVSSSLKRSRQDLRI